MGFSIKITGMSTPTFLLDLVRTLAYNLRAALAAFDAWSPLKSHYILVWGFMVYVMDSMIRKWFSIASASKGNIFKNKPIPSKDLKFNWEYIDTLDQITRLNLHGVIAVFHGRLHYAGYSKMTKYPVLSLITLKDKVISVSNTQNFSENGKRPQHWWKMLLLRQTSPAN